MATTSNRELANYRLWRAFQVIYIASGGLLTLILAYRFAWSQVHADIVQGNNSTPYYLYFILGLLVMTLLVILAYYFIKVAVQYTLFGSPKTKKVDDK